jgi:hypothetical protein
MEMNFLKIKKLTLFAFLALFLLNSCSDKNSVLIRVKITSNKDSKVYLEKLNFSNSIVLDSADISKGESNISFRTKAINEPTFFVLRLTDKGAITLLSDPGEIMDLSINAEKIEDYSVTGSIGSMKTKELAAKLEDTKAKLYALRLKYNLSQDEIIKSMIEKDFNTVIDSQHAYSSRFIWANAMSRSSVMAAYQKYDENSYVLDRPEDLVLLKAVASSLRAFYPNSDYTKGMIAEIKKIESNFRKSMIRDLVSQSMTTLPEIALPNPQGEIIKLSQFKGKVILLDFWASWDQTSMMDNRELLDIYRQYKNRGFEIYQVSLDVNRDEWVNAIESAGLPWVNVCELNPNGSLSARNYNVNQLPANYLIDRNHTIIGKNLYGESLKKKLQEVF